MHFAEVQVTAWSNKDDVTLDVFIYNDGYSLFPDGTVALENHPHHETHDDHRDLTCEHSHLGDHGDQGHKFHVFHQGNHDHIDEATICVPLSEADIAYFQSLPDKRIKIKLVAVRTSEEDEEGKPPFKLITDKVAFKLTGQASVDQRGVEGERVVLTGNLASSSAADTTKDDSSYLTVASSDGVVELQLTSAHFAFSRLDTVSVPIVLRATQDPVELHMFVYNPNGAGHGGDGFSGRPDLKARIRLKDADWVVTLQIPKEDVAFLNDQSPVPLTIRIRASQEQDDDDEEPPSEFELAVDMVRFLATTTDEPGNPARKVTHQYIDPGVTDPDLATVASGEGYLLRIYNLHPGLMNVNWAFDPPISFDDDGDDDDALPSIRVYKGLVVGDIDLDDDDDGCGDDEHDAIRTLVAPGRITDQVSCDDDDDHHHHNEGNTLMAGVSARSGQPLVNTGFIEVDVGLYTIVFCNGEWDDDDLARSTVTTKPFAPSGDLEDTWIHAPAYREYLVLSILGGTGVKAVIRQVPGPMEPPLQPWTPGNVAWTTHLVSIDSWSVTDLEGDAPISTPTPQAGGQSTPSLTPTPVPTTVILSLPTATAYGHAYSDGDTDGDGDCRAHAYSDGDADGHSDGYTHPRAHAYSDGDTHGDSDGYTHPCAHAYSDGYARTDGYTRTYGDLDT